MATNGNAARRAQSLVGEALRSGALVKGFCSLCFTNEDVEGHHEDYSKPLEVVWLCKKHHTARHQELGRPLMSTDALHIRDVDSSLLKRLKIVAAMNDSTLRQITIQALEDWLLRNYPHVT